MTTLVDSLELLGLNNSTVDMNQLKQAFKEKALTLNPDNSTLTPEVSAHMFLKYNTAYTIVYSEIERSATGRITTEEKKSFASIIRGNAAFTEESHHFTSSPSSLAMNRSRKIDSTSFSSIVSSSSNVAEKLANRLSNLESQVEDLKEKLSFVLDANSIANKENSNLRQEIQNLSNLVTDLVLSSKTRSESSIFVPTGNFDFENNITTTSSSTSSPTTTTNLSSSSLASASSSKVLADIIESEIKGGDFLSTVTPPSTRNSMDSIDEAEVIHEDFLNMNTFSIPFFNDKKHQVDVFSKQENKQDNIDFNSFMENLQPVSFLSKNNTTNNNNININNNHHHSNNISGDSFSSLSSDNYNNSSNNENSASNSPTPMSQTNFDSYSPPTTLFFNSLSFTPSTLYAPQKSFSSPSSSTTSTTSTTSSLSANSSVVPSFTPSSPSFLNEEQSNNCLPSSSSDYGATYTTSADGIITCTIQVEDAVVGPLVGKGGMFIKEFVAISGATIAISPKGTDLRVMTISGDNTQVIIAYRMVENRLKVLEEGNNNNNVTQQGLKSRQSERLNGSGAINNRNFTPRLRKNSNNLEKTNF